MKVGELRLPFIQLIFRLEQVPALESFSPVLAGGEERVAGTRDIAV